MRKEFVLPLIVMGFFLLLHFVFPTMLTAILSVSLLGIIIHGLAPFFYFRREAKKNGESVGTTRPKVSIHIPCSNEPPALVIQTLKCALSSDYQNFEIIVIDNNTSKKSLWKPVESFCQENQVVFRHYDKLKGYKAGALNEALKLTATDAKYIFICDADYCLQKNAISRAVQLAENEEISLLQFPQAYRNVNSGNHDLKEEFFHYFKVYSNASNTGGNTLATGTLTLLNRKDLDRLQGWRSHSITEDASLGVAFRSLGFKTRYIHEKIGHGLMPENGQELRKQRTRWMFGNIQTLKELLRSNMALKDKLQCMLQLTAWINFLGIPFLALIANLIYSLFFNFPAPQHVELLILSSFSIYLILRFLVFLVIAGTSRSFLIHLSFIWEGAFCWWGALLGQKKPFHKTCKEKGKEENVMFNLQPAILLAIMAVFNFWDEQYLFAAISFGFSLLLLSAGFKLSEQLFETRKIHIKSNKL